MPVVSVWKCPKTGKLFENKVKYIKHLRNLGNERRILRQKDAYRNEWDNKLNELSMLSNQTEICDWIESHSKLLLMNAINHAAFRTHVPKYLDTFDIKIVSLRLKYRDRIACTHSAPRGRKSNWHGDHSSPTHFPGWKGNIEFGVSEDTYRYGSDYFKNTGIYTGTGSSWHDVMHNGKKYRGYHYDIILWEDDWPGLKMYRVLTLEE